MTCSRGYDTLLELSRGSLALTHEALDTIQGRGHTTLYLRVELVVHGALPERYEQSAQVSALIDRELSRLPDGPDRLHLRTFATWKVLHELSRAERRGTARRNSHAHARRQILTASELLHWIFEHDLTLEGLRQEHLDRWLAEGPERRKNVRAFIRWAVRRGITGPLTVNPPSTQQHVDPANQGERLAQLHRLLTDDSLDLRDRVAGSLVLLFAQRISRLVLIAKDDVQERDRRVFLRLGNEPLLLPKPLATLTRQLRDTPPNPTTPNTSCKWLFPGRLPGTNLSEHYMRERLTRQGIKALPARNSAVLQLGQAVPAAILADLLGFHENTTERWTKLAGGDWTRYAAARASTTQPTDDAPHSASALRAPAP
jgi:integrase